MVVAPRSPARPVRVARHRTALPASSGPPGDLAVKDPDLAARWASLELLYTGALGRQVREHYQARGFRFPGLPGAAPPLLAQHAWVHVLADHGTSVESELEVFAFIAVPCRSRTCEPGSEVPPKVTRGDRRLDLAMGAGGISPFQHNAGRRLAAQLGRPYDALVPSARCREHELWIGASLGYRIDDWCWWWWWAGWQEAGGGGSASNEDGGGDQAADLEAVEEAAQLAGTVIAGRPADLIDDPSNGAETRRLGQVPT